MSRKPSRAALSVALNVSKGQVSKCVRRGMPVHSVAAASSWYEQNIRYRAGGRVSDESAAADIAQSKARQQAATAALLEAKAAAMRASLVDKAGVDRAVNATSQLLQKRIGDELPARHAAELAAITDPWTAECRLRELLRQALTAVSVEAQSMVAAAERSSQS